MPATALRIRLVDLQPGLQCWTREIYQYALPAGLGANVPVTIVALYGQDIVVRDGAGRDWTVCNWQVERLEYQGHGDWRDESDPAVLDYLPIHYRELSTRRWPEPCERERGALLAHIVDVLRRHGRMLVVDG